MSQVNRLTGGGGGGSVNSVSAGANISITGTATDPIVNVAGTTNHTVQIGTGSTGLTSLANGTTGQVLTAQTGADPIWSTPASTAITLTGNTGGALSPTADNFDIVTGNSTVIFAGATSTLTLDFAELNLLLGSNGSALTTGAGNVGVGLSSGDALEDGNDNTALGGLALQNLVSGSNNIVIGALSGSNYTTTESDNILIGNAGIATENGITRIGSSGVQNAVYIAGIEGVSVGSVAVVATVNSDQIGTSTITAGGNIVVTPGPNDITISVADEFITLYTNVNSSPYVVDPTDQYISVDSSGGPITVQLPNAPVTGKPFTIKDRTGSAATNNITVTTVGGATNIDGATTFVMNTNYQSINIMSGASAYEVF